MSAWEIGKLVATRKLRLPFDPLDFFNRFIATAGVSICTVSPEILVRSSMLPDFAHRDPMDCILVATARIKDYTIVTSDRKILDYGRRGHVKTLSC